MNELNSANRQVAMLETAPTRYVEGGGIRFAYRQLGPSGGTPLVLLQHFSGNIDAWDPAVVNTLAEDRPVIAFDNAGVGRSTGQTPDNIAAMARDARAFINLLNFSTVDLLGFSLGGCIAQQITAEHGSLVRKLVCHARSWASHSARHHPARARGLRQSRHHVAGRQCLRNVQGP
jgi:pimeloyl-ACP methyl ester carboxylesterase